MRAFIFIWSLIFSLNVNAQTNSRSGNPINYIGSNVINGSSNAVIVDNVPLVHTRQFLPINKKGAVVDRSNLSAQIDLIFRDISQTLRESGSKLNQIIKLNVFVARTEFIIEAKSFISKKFHPEKQPSVTFAAGELPHPDALISIDAIAV